MDNIFVFSSFFRPNKEALPEVVAFFRRVVLRHSQGMKLGANSLLGLPSITTKVTLNAHRITSYIDPPCCKLLSVLHRYLPKRGFKEHAPKGGTPEWWEKCFSLDQRL